MEIYGPYKNRSKFRVIVVDSGRRTSYVLESKQAALDFMATCRAGINAHTVLTAIEDYLVFLERRGLRENTLATAGYLLNGIMKPVHTLPLVDLTAARAVKLYNEYASTHRPTSHHNALKAAKAWGAWNVGQGCIRANPWIGVTPVGRKSHGKKQLRIDDTVKLYAWCVDNITDDRACAVLLGIVLGLRASEIVGLTKADLDDKGRVLWINHAKTNAGVRALRLPEVVRAALAPRMGRDRLLPYTRWWVLTATKAACALAGVPKVTAHSLRGSSATLALEAGESALAVARTLGQAGTTTLWKSYAQPGSGDSARVQSVVDRLSPSVSPFPDPEGTSPSN